MRICCQIAEFLNDAVEGKGVGVVMEASHLCSMMQGLKKQDAHITTSTMLGSFRNNEATRLEFPIGLSKGANRSVF